MDNTTPLPASTSSRMSKKYILGIGFVTAAVIFGTFLFFFLKSKSVNPQMINVPQPAVTPPVSTDNRILPYRQWVNCSDVRDVIEENNTLYVACLGGVLIVNKTDGTITDQISMTQGLGDATTTSLAKKGDILFIGTQDGFTRFNLQTQEAKKISVKEGLISGGNIKLEVDGDTLWVATFEGLSRYDIETGTITNFTSELTGNSTHYGLNEVLATPKGVYAIVQANAYSTGGLARYDKTSKTWSTFDVYSFVPEKQDYPRVDLFNLAYVGDKVYVSDNKTVWEGKDEMATDWKKIEAIEPLKSQDHNLVRIFGNGTKLYVLIAKTLYDYSLSGEIKKIYPTTQSDEENIFSNASNVLLNPFRGETFWTRAMSTDSNLWLRSLRFDTLESGAVPLSGRPQEITSLLATVDGDVYLCGDGKLWKYGGANKTFNKFGEIDCSDIQGIINFQPLAGTNNILTYSQTCGQGCEKPKLFVLNFDDQSLKSIPVSDELLKELGGTSEYGYPPLTFKGIDEEKNIASFTYTKYSSDVNTPSSSLMQVDIDLKNFSWNSPYEEKDHLTSVAFDSQIFCNPSYTYKENKNTFSSLHCEKRLTNESYRWSFKEPNESREFVQENIKTGEKKTIHLPSGAPLRYSPFDNFFHETITSATTTSHYLGTGGTTGLILYDPATSSFKIYTTNEGLVANEVNSFIIDEEGKTVWALSTWGGLSQLPL